MAKEPISRSATTMTVPASLSVRDQLAQSRMAKTATTNHELAADAHDLNMDESEAMCGYEKFLLKHGKMLTAEQVAKITGIIAEEKKHVIINNEIIAYFDGGIKPEK